MKLLFDENLSIRLVKKLEHLFPGSTHVSSVGLDCADDILIWEYAKANGFGVISKDADFHQRSFLFGPPPKVIWLKSGNSTTTELFELINTSAKKIRRFMDDTESAFFVLERKVRARAAKKKR